MTLYSILISEETPKMYKKYLSETLVLDNMYYRAYVDLADVKIRFWGCGGYDIYIYKNL